METKAEHRFIYLPSWVRPHPVTLAAKFPSVVRCEGDPQMMNAMIGQAHLGECRPSSIKKLILSVSHFK